MTERDRNESLIDKLVRDFQSDFESADIKR